MDGQWAKFGGSVWNNAKSIKRKTSGVLKEAHESISQYPRVPEWVLPLLILPQSPTPHLLCCNYPPTEPEIRLISDMIDQVKVVADRLETELDDWRRDISSGTRLPIEQMQRSLESAKEFIKKHQAILSAVRRLPAEILQEIIALSTVPYLDIDRTVMGSAEVESSFHRGFSCLPLAQSQVSRFWRGTAISSSALWNKLPSFPLDQAYTTSPRFLYFLDILLDQWCAKESLDFHVHSRSPGIATSRHPVMVRLLSRSSCWKRAVFQVPSFHWALFCGAAGRLQFPSLQSLVIVFPPWPLQIYHTMTIDLFQNAPRLSSVIFVRADASLFLLPYNQLVHYREDQCESTLLNQLLENPSSLQALEFKEDFSFIMSAPSRIAWMNELTVLRMQLLFQDDECPILDSFVLPALKELSIKIRVCSALHANVIPPVHSMILRSGKPSAIEKLQLYSGHMVARELSSLLRDTPLLTHLNVSLPPAEDIRRLAITEGDDVIVPLLRVCTFYLNVPLEQGVFQSQNEQSAGGLFDQDQARLCRRLAVNRCELPGRDRMDIGGGDDSLISGTSVLKCLRAFYIDCKDIPSTASQRNILQQWSQESTSLFLQDIRDELIGYIRGTTRSTNIMSPNLIMDIRDELSDYFWSPPRSNIMSPISISNKTEVRYVRGVLSTLKNLEIRRVEDIYVSKIHRTLHRMVNHFGTFKGPQHAYSQDAQQILNKWMPLFQASLGDIHWGIYWNYVYYLSKTSSLRASSAGKTRVVFGYYEKNDIPHDDPPWPMTASTIQDANSP